MDTKKLFVFVLMGLFMISMASALEFDNVKSYDPVSREVTITNAFGLGDDIGKARLNTPLNVKVGAGYQKVAEFDIWAYQDYNDAIKQFTFTDMKKKEKINRDFDLKILSYEDVVMDDYEDVENGITVNGTINYDYVKVGSHTEKREVWTKVTPADLKKNEVVTIGIFTDVQIGDHVDWIPTIYGVEVEEWAEWTQSLNTNLETYWKLDESAGSTAIDELNNWNGTGGGGYSVGTTGLIGDAWDLDGTDASIIISTSQMTAEETRTVNLWVYSTTGGTSRIYATEQVNEAFMLRIDASNKLWFEVRNKDSPSWVQIIAPISTAITLNSWQMVTLTIESVNQNVTIFLNGVQEGNGQWGAYNTGDADIQASVGGRYEYFDGLIDEVGFWKRVLTQDEITQLYNGGSGITYTDIFDSPPEITLNSPTADANYSSPQSFTFNFSASDDINLQDVKLYVNDVLNQTNATGINDTYYYFNLDLGDGDWGIYGVATDNESQSTASTDVNFTIDSTAPTLTTALNLTDQTTWTLPINSTWNYTASDNHIDKCYYTTSDNATQTFVTCNASITTTWATGGNKTIEYCANDTFGNEACLTSYALIYYVAETQTESNDPTVEGLTETWTFTVNLTGIPTTTANLLINDTYYSPTTTTAGANGYIFTFTKQIPDTWGNTTGNILDWRWNYTIDGVVTSRNTTLENITVYELAIDDCSTYGDVILNMSLKDEETKTAVNESAGANVEIDLTLQSKANSSITLDYSKTWMDENNPLVCIPNNVLNDTQYWMDFTIGFSSTDHVWEFFYLDDGTLNSSKVFDVQTSTPLDFYDLLTDDSTSFLFNYFDQDGLAVEDTIVHVYRKYIGDGEFKEVERAKADQNGDTIVHLVEEDVIYYFVISQYGVPIFTSSTYTALCQATPCTIQIEASGGSADFPTDWDLVDNGAYSISSSASTRMVTLDYATTNTSTFNLTVYKYNSDGSYSAINTTSDTGTSGAISLYVPQSAGNVSFFATIEQDDEFKNSEWVDFEGNASDRFGITTALFIASLIILTLGLMAVSEGVGTLVFVVLGVMLSGFLGLIQVELSTGVNVVIYLVLAGGILLWKLTGGRR